MELRPYQHEVVSMVVENEGDMLIQAPTGAGKTIMFSKIIEELSGRGLKCLVLAHRGELIRQAQDKLEKATGLECGIFSAYMGKKEISPITVASIQSLARFRGDIYFDVVIIDEAHRVRGPLKESQYKTVLDPLQANGARILGFTATPYRLDIGYIYGELGWWNELSYQIPLRQLIDEGHLCDYLHRIALSTIKVKNDLKGVKKTAGDYNAQESSDLMTQSMNLHSIINTVQEEKSIVVFCVSIFHAECLGGILEDDFAIVHSKMKAEDRDEHLRKFDAGEVRWMLNVGVLTEGWDCPRVDAIVLARPTKSTSLYVQMVGRGLRNFLGKMRCVIYDIVGAYEEFGFVDDPNINEDQERKVCKTKVCEECLSVIPSNAQICPECGFSFAKEIEEKEKNEDEEDDAFEMKELSIHEHPDFGDVTTGSASHYTSKSGNECLMVKYFHTKRGKPVVHFYPTNQKWIGTKFATIARKYCPKFKETWLSPDRFMKAVNGGHVFPMKNLKVMTDKAGYEKISTL
tara:strand:- start:311 stop:1861 length:1551 start_codon:yes stop_codon:yes gene_type:complete